MKILHKLWLSLQDRPLTRADNSRLGQKSHERPAEYLLMLLQIKHPHIVLVFVHFPAYLVSSATRGRRDLGTLLAEFSVSTDK
jgi:hypothetical protein